VINSPGAILFYYSIPFVSSSSATFPSSRARTLPVGVHATRKPEPDRARTLPAGVHETHVPERARKGSETRKNRARTLPVGCRPIESFAVLALQLQRSFSGAAGLSKVLLCWHRNCKGPLSEAAGLSKVSLCWHCNCKGPFSEAAGLSKGLLC
jgi:hypothetical protein